MQYPAICQSSAGGVLLAGDALSPPGLRLEGEKFPALSLEPAHEAGELPATANRWLDIYCPGREPASCPLDMLGSELRLCAGERLRRIPCGKSVTCGELAKQAAQRRGLTRMSAQAVGGTGGHDAIFIIVPCHCVGGADGSLTGHAGEADKKRRLPHLEHGDVERVFMPIRGTALSCCTSLFVSLRAA